METDNKKVVKNNNNFKLPQQQQSESQNVVSLSINAEIHRFESVHPSIYSIYELIEHIPDLQLTNLIRQHVVNIEDSFVNSEEWTLSRSVRSIHIGLLGSVSSPKSTLVHRYLTGQFVQDNSPEGGRFKKELIIDKCGPCLLLIRDEGGSPELQFTHWLDVLILVANSLENVSVCYSYISRLANYKCLNDIPIVLVAVSNDSNDSYENEFKKIPHNYYINVNVQNGENVEKCFTEACLLAINKNNSNSVPLATPNSVRKNNFRRRSNIFSTNKKTQDIDNDCCDGNTITEFGVGRVIPLKQGYLLKKSKNYDTKLNKKWKKKYVILTELNINYYDNINNYMERKKLVSIKKCIDLKHSNVKYCNNSSDDKRFQVNTRFKVYEFECGNKIERDEWIEAIEKQILFCILQENTTNCHGNNFMQKYCADCNELDANWVSINFGVVICIGCSGLHRALGSHVSKVRSLELDDLSPVVLKILNLVGGNERVNNLLFESSLKYKWINNNSTKEEKMSFIKRKYEQLEFFPSEINVTMENLINSINNQDFISFLGILLKFDKQKLYQHFEEIVLIVCGMENDGDAYLQSLLWVCDDVDERTKICLKSKISSFNNIDENVKTLLFNL